MATDRQIALGMSRTDVEARLGPPAGEADADVSYLETTPIQDARGRVVGQATGTLTLRYANNRVTSVIGWRVLGD